MDPPLSPRGRTPKAAWDRPGIFPKRKVHFIILDTEAKVKNITAELAQLKVCNAPISVGVFLRTLIEISVKHCIKENKNVSPSRSAYLPVNRGYTEKFPANPRLMPTNATSSGYKNVHSKI